MKRRIGPCEWCGTHTDRQYRPGRQHLCIECAILKSRANNEAAAANAAPHTAKRDRANAEMARQIAAREGPLFEKWRAGQLRSLGLESAGDTG